MLEKLTKFVGKYPKSIIAAVILLTVFFYFGLSKVDVVSDLEEMFPEDDPVKTAYDQVDATFGGAKFAMIILDMNEVFSVSALQEIDRLTLDLEKVKGVNSVLSITNVEEIRGIEDGIEVVELIEEIPDNEAELLELKHRVLSNDDYAGQIISENGKIALVMVQLLPEAAEENVIQDIREIIHRHELDKKAYLTGEAVLDQEVDKAIVGDMSRLLPLAILMMIGILYISFRNIRGVVLPLLIVIITVIWTMGMMGYFGIPLSPISNIMPIILISMGIADGIHILARYREGLAQGLDKQKALFATVVAVGLACLITSVTTMAGFGSLYTSSLIQIKDFGLSTAIGVGIAFIITVTFFLAFLYLLRPAKRELDKKRKILLKGTLVKWAGFVITRAKTVLIIAGLLVVLASAGIPLINPESDFIDFFKPGSPVRSAYNLVTENFGGANIIQIAVKGNIQDPEVLQAMEHLQNDIERIEILSKPGSIVNLLRNTNKALHEGKPEYEMLPKTEEEVAQYLLLLSMGGSDQLDNMLSFDYEQALIQSRVSTTKNSERDKMINKVEKAIEKHFDSNNEVVLTGSPILAHNMVNLMIKGQLQSLVLAILFVFVLMVIISRSLIYGAFCTVPITLTVILNFGIMGWFKIPLDVASAIIASIVIGIGIDYAIHFFSRYKEELAIGKSVEQALKITISNTGQAIFYNAAAVGLGFLVLIFASMPPLARFGWLIALTMFFSSMASMTVLPALLYLRDRRREK
ncbi:RND family transporter [candidate division WOR-3 bacterium]|nr:RND family transporter [candidate division WOR-3 bacterium]